jgi:hypothetical protein
VSLAGRVDGVQSAHGGIAEISVDYSTVIDRHRFDDLDRVFTPGAHTDF